MAVDMRTDKAMELANRGRVVDQGNGSWLVFPLSDHAPYRVRLLPKVSCTCDDFDLRRADCKHIIAARIVASREADGCPPEPAPETPPVKWPRKTYRQDWPNYNKAQQNEKAEFRRLLADLCSTVEQPPPKGGKKGGRPTVLLSDAIFASVFKIYCGMSGRRFDTDLREAQETGFIAETMSYSTIARCLEDEATTPILTRLIEVSALPFTAIETEFGADSSGFSSCKFDRWYSEKYGRLESEHSWNKVHVMTGTSTHIVAAVVVGSKGSADYSQFPTLLNTTARGFKVKQASGDKAYCGEENFQAVEAVGGTAYIAFKSNATGSIGGLYRKMYHLFCANREEYLRHYHRRSNVESVFSAVKRLFGDSVRSKTDEAMRNEVLGKLLAYNITQLVHAIYELGLEPAFGNESAAPAILNFPGVG
jgi:transposase